MNFVQGAVLKPSVLYQCWLDRTRLTLVRFSAETCKDVDLSNEETSWLEITGTPGLSKGSWMEG